MQKQVQVFHDVHVNCEPQKVKPVCELLILVVGSKVKWKVRGNDLISRLCKNMDGKIGTFIWLSPPSKSHLTSVRC